MDKSGWVIGEELARQARAGGHRACLTFQSHPDVTYAEADEIAHRVSRGVAALGVGPGDRVGVWLPNGPEILHASFGIYRAAAGASPCAWRPPPPPPRRSAGSRSSPGTSWCVSPPTRWAFR